MNQNNKPPSKSIAAVLGNGVSITAEPTLAIPSLTAEISKRYNQFTGAHYSDPVQRVLARLAQRGADTGDPRSDFEAMIGPLDQRREDFADLRELVDIIADEVQSVKRAFYEVDNFVAVLRRHGVGHALDVIASRSRADYEHRQRIDDFIAAIVDASDRSGVTFGNLSYDLLVMASLIDQYEHRLCDMADGRSIKPVNLKNEADALPAIARPLRTQKSDFLPLGLRNVRLLHLHGSLTWLRDPETGIVYRFPVEALRETLELREDATFVTMPSHWERWRTGASEWEPQVVLTNQSAKSDVVAREPFSLGYDVLYDDLLRADRWIIAGYSFRDECVNDLLKRAYAARETAPMVLVVTKGDGITQDEVLDALGWNFWTDPAADVFLRFHRDGVESAPSSDVWAEWVSFGSGSSAMGA